MPRPTKISKIGKCNQLKGVKKHHKYMEDVREAKALNKVNAQWQVLKAFMEKKSPETFCHHLRIGSSQFKRLVDGTLLPTQVHNKVYFYGARGAGAMYENEFASYAGLKNAEGEEITFGDKWGQEFRMSSKFPFICATPDFRTTFQINKQRTKECLVEVKSTTKSDVREQAMESDNNDATMQLLCSMDIFDIKNGFLVYYLKPSNADDIREEEFDVDFKKVVADNFLNQRREQIIDGYTSYLIKLLGSYTKEENAAKQLWEEIKNFVIDYCEMFKTTHKKSSGGHPRQDYRCAFGRTLPAFTKKNPPIIGRPKKVYIHKATGKKYYANKPLPYNLIH